MEWGHVKDVIGESEIYFCKLIFAVYLLKEDEINDLKTAEIKSTRVISFGCLENNCYFRAFQKSYKKIFRRF